MEETGRSASLEKNPSDEEDDADGNHNNGGSSSNSTVEESERKGSPGSVRQYNRSKNPGSGGRRIYTVALSTPWRGSVAKIVRATPKLILQMMNVRGLSIAHVKSHLQMYRSKKIDDSGQVIGLRGNVMERSIGRHLGYLRQLPMLQGLYQSPLTCSRQEDSPWFSHGRWIRKQYPAVTQRPCPTSVPGSAPEMIFGYPARPRALQELQKSKSTLADRLGERLFAAHQSLQLPNQHRSEGSLDEASNSTDGDVKRHRQERPAGHPDPQNSTRCWNGDDCGLDLTLSLKDEEDEGSLLSLSSFSLPSKTRNMAVGTKLPMLREEGISDQPTRVTSTLNLTI
ncbi:unnamed protein product [Spirodela intermedia]|uniref:Uncharacterized protein n=1 Tax=Spirodela intermedia TaxID=51605 RepID=A0A7I8IAX1_SPIIN|nr:unnamed protein product [Spirodela intermedia]CAA6654718.1 unnamed protein product [Spirodela intermedia]